MTKNTVKKKVSIIIIVSYTFFYTRAYIFFNFEKLILTLTFEKELERLQKILFYCEFDFSLKKIQKAMPGESAGIEVLMEEQELLNDRLKRLYS